MTLGIAQRLYLSTANGHTPWKAQIDLCQALFYDALDCAIAHALAQELNEASEDVLVALCHLSAAVQQGHLCIQVTSTSVSPSVDDLFGASALDPLALQSLICRGFTRIVEKIGDYHPLLHADGSRLYFHRHWAAETSFVDNLNRLESTEPTIDIAQPLLKKQLNELVQQTILLQEQADAILKVSQHTLTIITGGPGTGKTYTAGQCICLIWQALSTEQQTHFQIALAAPTGKAAAHLEANVMKHLQSVDHFPPLTAQTLHALLGRKHSEPRVLDPDLILVDECSMIDAQLFAELLSAVKPGTRLILMGDAEQLPAVEAGGLFADLVRAKTHASCLALLKVCRRTESKDILDFASAVRQADWSQVRSLFTTGQDVRRLQLIGSIQEQYQQLLRHTISRFAIDVATLENPQALRQYLNAFRMLSPLRKGSWGVDQLNALFHEHARMLGMATFPIMITKNDYDKSLFNGDIGVHVHSRGQDYALFLHEGNVRRLNISRLPPYTYAYCLSVHKSQGSEFQDVLLLIPEGAEHFGRGLFYTAATRARSHLEVFGSDETLSRMLQQHSERMSGVTFRLELAEIPPIR